MPDTRPATMDDFLAFSRDRTARRKVAKRKAKAKASKAANRADVLKRRAANAKKAAANKRKRATKRAPAKGTNPISLPPVGPAK